LGKPGRSTALQPNRSISMSRCLQASGAAPVTYRNAFAYIFAGPAPSRCVEAVCVKVEKEVDGEELEHRDMSAIAPWSSSTA